MFTFEIVSVPGSSAGMKSGFTSVKRHESYVIGANNTQTLNCTGPVIKGTPITSVSVEIADIFSNYDIDFNNFIDLKGFTFVIMPCPDPNLSQSTRLSLWCGKL